jgi:hypothetical protein
MITSEWNIAKSERRCTVCDKTFAEEEGYYSAVYDAGAAFERRDFCDGCWATADRGTPFSFWRTEVPRADQPKKMFVDDAVIFDFFKRLADEEDQATKRNFRYLLGLMLMRKKFLKFQDVDRRGGKEYLVLRRSRTKEEHRVLNPDLTEEELESVKAELTHILETGVD